MAHVIRWAHEPILMGVYTILIGFNLIVVSFSKYFDKFFTSFGTRDLYYFERGFYMILKL